MTRILGIDAGIASIGFALVDCEEAEDKAREKGEIISCGSHIFERAENPKDGSSLALPRRNYRGQRRRLNRKRRRLDAVLRLFKNSNFEGLEVFDRLTEGLPNLSPWQLRSEALSRKLSDIEFARSLFHIAKRRGFQSNRKHAGPNDDDGKKMLEGAEALRKAMSESGRKTIGAYLATLDKPLNKHLGYERTVTQDLLRDEVGEIFECQATLGQNKATTPLKEEFLRIAFHRRPLKSSLDLVGYCSLEPTQKRAPKMAYHAELFVLWSRLNNLRLEPLNGMRQPLNLEQKRQLEDLAHRNASGLSFAQVRKALQLDDTVTFNLVSYRKKDIKREESWDELRKRCEKTNLAHLKGYHILRKVFKEGGECHWSSLRARESALDKMAYALSFFEEEEEIRRELSELDLSKEQEEALMQVADDFKQTLDLSLEAIVKLLPHMQKGEDYSTACDIAYPPDCHQKDKRGNRVPPFKDVRNPVVNRALAQCRKVINAVIARHGCPT